MAIKIRKTRDDKRARLAKFVQLYSSGYTRDEISHLMGLKDGEYDTIVDAFYEEAEKNVTEKSPLRIFAEYTTRQNQFVRDLEALKAALISSKWKNGQAFVAAVRTQSDILDKIIKVGQDLGLIVKTPDQVMIVGGKDARDLSTEDLINATKREMEEVKELLMRGSKAKSSAKILSLFPGKG